MSDIAIRVEGIGKKYRIGKKKSGELRETFGNFFRSFKSVVASQQPATQKDFWALKNISFEVKKGEAIGIIGRNGAGKSTLLKVLSRITKPTTGRFELNGRVSSLLEVGTGFHPELTGRENIYLNGTILGMRRTEIKAKFDEIIAFSGVEEFIDTPVKHYSSGMKVRLAFSVAAHLEPEILIIDEVLAVGDVEFQKKCLGKMEDVTSEGRTVLFVSHNMDAIEKLCENSVLIDSGQILSINNSSYVIEKYLTSNRIEFNQSKEQILNPFVRIKNKFFTYDDNVLNYTFSLGSSKINKINGVALLFYNAKDVRVAIKDLRSFDLIETSKTEKQILLSGVIPLKPFLPGKYFIGLYLDSNFYQGNIERISSFEVKDKELDFLPYPISVRGVFNV